MSLRRRPRAKVSRHESLKVVRQLAREFWLPLTLGIAWTAFNFLGRSLREWSFRDFVNVLGPTFFFMSWLFAQWYRVRKQQRVEDDLQDIRTSVLALREPLLPCAVFATLRSDLRDQDVKRMFKANPGLDAYAPDKALPEPFANLGISDGRLMLPFGYLDFTDGRVTAAGAFVMRHPGYNVIHCPVMHTIVRVQPDATITKVLPDEPLFQPHLKLEFYFGGRPRSTTETPSLVLTSGMDSSSVLRASAFDKSIFVDVSVEHLIPKPVSGTWSIENLRGAFLRATLDFHILDNLHDYPDQAWPSLHNFQLWFGDTASKLLTFSPDQLKGQVLQANPSPIFARGAASSQIVFECEVSEDVFEGLLART